MSATRHGGGCGCHDINTDGDDYLNANWNLLCNAYRNRNLLCNAFEHLL